MLKVLQGLALVGTVRPEQIPDEIQGRSFRVVDKNYTVRVLMSTDKLGY